MCSKAIVMYWNIFQETRIIKNCCSTFLCHLVLLWCRKHKHSISNYAACVSCMCYCNVIHVCSGRCKNCCSRIWINTCTTISRYYSLMFCPCLLFICSFRVKLFAFVTSDTFCVSLPKDRSKLLWYFVFLYVLLH